MGFVSVFNDVMGPVMRGPSSSHTAGAYRIGSMVRSLAGDAPSSVRVTLIRLCTASDWPTGTTMIPPIFNCAKSGPGGSSAAAVTRIRSDSSEAAMPADASRAMRPGSRQR